MDFDDRTIVMISNMTKVESNFGFCDGDDLVDLKELGFDKR